MAKAKQQGISEDTKAIITVLLLIFFYPIGVIVMWLWTKWPIWVKILVSFLFIIAFIGLVAAILVVLINPVNQLEKAKRAQQMQQDLPYQQVVTPTPTLGNY